MKMSVFFVFVVLAAAGCGQNCDSILQEDKQLRSRNIELTRNLQQLKKKNADLSRQLNVVSGMRSDFRLENVISTDHISISKRTGLYDKNADGVIDKLIVYLKTIDKYDDAIKAPGSVEVTLWDLAREGTKLKQWNITAEQLNKKWAALMMSSYYRLAFDVSDVNIPDKEVTVKVEFTDYITGKVFSRQAVVSNNRL